MSLLAFASLKSMADRNSVQNEMMGSVGNYKEPRNKAQVLNSVGLTNLSWVKGPQIISAGRVFPSDDKVKLETCTTDDLGLRDSTRSRDSGARSSRLALG